MPLDMGPRWTERKLWGSGGSAPGETVYFPAGSGLPFLDTRLLPASGPLGSLAVWLSLRGDDACMTYKATENV